jgi:hypothetical protein
MAVVPATFQKCGKLVAVKAAVSHAVRHQLMPPHPRDSRKASNIRMLAIARIPAYASNRRIYVEKLNVAGN